MGTIGAYSSALTGMNAAAAQLNTAAADIASSASQGDAGGIASDSVQLSLAKILFKADTEILRTADQMTGSLLDVMA